MPLCVFRCYASHTLTERFPKIVLSAILALSKYCRMKKYIFIKIMA